MAELRAPHCAAGVALLTLLLLLAPPQARAQPPYDQPDTATELAGLRADIARIKAQLAEREQTRDRLQDELEVADKEIGALDQQLDSLRSQQQTLTEELQALQKAGEVLTERKLALTSEVELGIRQLWLLQQDGGLRVWLGDQDPQQTATQLAYYQLMLADQQTRLNEYETALLALEENTQAVRRAETQLAERNALIASTREASMTHQDARRTTLAAINDRLRSDTEQLAALTANEQRLNRLLDDLQALALPSRPDPQPFVAARGKMPMPVAGAPANRFGAVRNAEIRWRGWHIPTAQGEPVSAIHGGRVIYADWLRGQGLLIVLDHGEGWLSLYAHNHSLLRTLGEQIEVGDVISRAGASGGNTDTGLYFEIRHQGDPVDPAEWVQR